MSVIVSVLSPESWKLDEELKAGVGLKMVGVGLKMARVRLKMTKVMLEGENMLFYIINKGFLKF